MRRAVQAAVVFATQGIVATLGVQGVRLLVHVLGADLANPAALLCCLLLVTPVLDRVLRWTASHVPRHGIVVDSLCTATASMVAALLYAMGVVLDAHGVRGAVGLAASLAASTLVLWGCQRLIAFLLLRSCARTLPPLEQRARHEASHAVVARATGQRVVGINLDVALRPHGVVGGCTEMRQHRRDDAASVFDDMCVWLAPMALHDTAEAMDAEMGNSGSDIVRSVLAARRLVEEGTVPPQHHGELEVHALVRGALQCARRHLDTRHAMVQALVDALVAQPDHRLGHEALHELTKESPMHPTSEQV